jgi:hypothetical protein
LNPLDALKWLEDHMLPVYPIGDFKVAQALEGLRF